MDAYAHHPYLERSELPPDFAHPNSTTIALADYDKLVELLGEAFDGTAQEGGDLPILYTEFGVQTEIPEEKRDAYTNLESPVANDAVPESTQQEYYRQAFELVCDQDNVEGLYIFHVWDEPDLLGWQSGPTTPTAVPSRAGTHSSIYHPVRERSVRRVSVLPRRSGLAAAPVEERMAGKDAFAEVVEDWSGRMDALRSYTVTGVRPDSDFFLWKITQRYEDLGELGAALNATPLAGWLETPYSYLATTKASQYTAARRARKVVPRGSPYLVVYPFVKIRPWYALSEDERQRAMDEHMRIGAEFATIHNHTTYSFGIDDQEFMTAFECDEPADFMHLMLTLRDSEASRYTERDTPIFVGQTMEIREALGARRLGSARMLESDPGRGRRLVSGPPGPRRAAWGQTP